MKIPGFLVFVTATTAIAGFLYGYDTGIISGALLQIANSSIWSTRCRRSWLRPSWSVRSSAR